MNHLLDRADARTDMAALAGVTVTTGAYDGDADEKIGLARIRLRLPVCGRSVVVSEFLDADRALIKWKCALQSIAACEYTVRFTDGATIQGTFSLSSDAKKLLSFSQIVRIALGAASPARGCHAACILLDRYGIPFDAALLKNYTQMHHLLSSGALRVKARKATW